MYKSCDVNFCDKFRRETKKKNQHSGCSRILQLDSFRKAAEKAKKRFQQLLCTGKTHVSLNCHYESLFLKVVRFEFRIADFYSVIRVGWQVLTHFYFRARMKQRMYCRWDFQTCKQLSRLRYRICFTQSHTKDSTGAKSDHILALLKFYLPSTAVNFNDEFYVQKKKYMNLSLGKPCFVIGFYNRYWKA